MSSKKPSKTNNKFNIWWTVKCVKNEFVYILMREERGEKTSKCSQHKHFLKGLQNSNINHLHRHFGLHFDLYPLPKLFVLQQLEEELGVLLQPLQPFLVQPRQPFQPLIWQRHLQVLLNQVAIIKMKKILIIFYQRSTSVIYKSNWHLLQELTWPALQNQCQDFWWLYC